MTTTDLTTTPARAPGTVPALVRPSGWKATGAMYAGFWTKPSKYGLRYMCPECGKKALGTTFRNDAHHHWPKCSRIEPNSVICLKDKESK